MDLLSTDETERKNDLLSFLNPTMKSQSEREARNDSISPLNGDNAPGSEKAKEAGLFGTVKLKPLQGTNLVQTKTEATSFTKGTKNESTSNLTMWPSQLEQARSSLSRASSTSSINSDSQRLRGKYENHGDRYTNGRGGMRGKSTPQSFQNPGRHSFGMNRGYNNGSRGGSRGNSRGRGNLSNQNKVRKNIFAGQISFHRNDSETNKDPPSNGNHEPIIQADSQEAGRGVSSSGSQVPSGNNQALSAIQVMAKKLAEYTLKSEQAFTARLTETPETLLQKHLQELQDHQRSLPIFKHKDDLIKMVQQNNVVIVIGETGSGKSTQIPQYLVGAGYATKGKIGITQPRRIAATSLAERVAEELPGNDVVGGKVGYAVRFDKKVSKNTVIKFMTDGFFSKECTNDPDFKEYSVIIVDEAHERTIHTDVTLGLVKRAVARRPNLRVIICSATLENKKLLDFFGIDASAMVEIKGRQHPVQIEYSPVPKKYGNDYLPHVVETVTKIHRNEKINEDILVFLPGKEEIDKIGSDLKKMQEFFVVPCHSILSFKEQQMIHDPAPDGKRKVVLATNIAETSLTIEGVVYVVDCGYFKQKHYDTCTNIGFLQEKRITKFHATQRTGRAGRTCPGKCYRLYSEYEYKNFIEVPDPDIKRLNIESVMLDLFAMGIYDFDHFLDKPFDKIVCEALEYLKELSAIDDDLGLTNLGKLMASLPMEAAMAKVLLTSMDLRCSSDVTIIVAMLCAQQHRSMFIRSRDPATQKAIDQIKAQFDHPDGDLLTLWRIYNEWSKIPKEERQDWCNNNYIEHHHLEEADTIKMQLAKMLEKETMAEGMINMKEVAPVKVEDNEWSINIRKAFTSGYFRQIAFHSKDDKYDIARAMISSNPLDSDNQVARLPYSSSLHKVNPKPEMVLFLEVTRNKKHRPFMSQVSPIEPQWFVQHAGIFASKFLKRWDRLTESKQQG